MQGVRTEQYQELYNAIVIQAVTDCRNALKGIGYDRISSEDAVRDCERFFRSDYFSMLTKVPGEYLIERIKKEVEDERNSNSTDT